jgi:hypothetical protein
MFAYGVGFLVFGVKTFKIRNAHQRGKLFGLPLAYGAIASPASQPVVHAA